ncbi:unnamed protein product [Mytilus edulis]|uniref:Uncharacterized protein n=1 Tax=Mytilus edulis TaxID=6550 RepID=A0A8S3UJ80_MYTED|nr:unnamed protein product [Mytilus edulis]
MVILGTGYLRPTLKCHAEELEANENVSSRQPLQIQVHSLDHLDYEWNGFCLLLPRIVKHFFRTDELEANENESSRQPLQIQVGTSPFPRQAQQQIMHSQWGTAGPTANQNNLQNMATSRLKHECVRCSLKHATTTFSYNEFYDTSNDAPFPGSVNISPDDTMGRFKKGGFSHKKYKSRYEKVSEAQKKRWNIPLEDHSYSTQQNTTRISSGSPVKDHKTYVSNLEKEIKFAYKTAANVAEKASKRHKTRYDLKVRHSNLQKGDRVLLKKVGFKEVILLKYQEVTEKDIADKLSA